MDLNKIESQAILDGGNAAGRFLEETFGETDLAKLSRNQYLQFLEAFLEGFGESMKKKVGTEVPF